MQVRHGMYICRMAEIGLRERSKARRRAAIIRAAYELFAERGYDATTVADIAEAAEVAPRTVAMYFPAKQDIALSRFATRREWNTIHAHLRVDVSNRTCEASVAIILQHLGVTVSEVIETNP